MDSAAPWGAGRSPYAGERPFTGRDSGVFFGRATEIDQVATQWRRHRLTVLYGSSGVGLTSLARAGVMPRAAAAVEVLPLGRVSSGSPFPLAALGEHNPHTLSLLSAWSPGEPLTRLADFTIADFFRKRWRYSRAAGAYGEMPAVLSVIDQAEELLTGQVSGGRFRDAFITELAEALREIPELHVLCCVRRDYREEFAARLAAGGCAVDAEFELRPLAAAAAAEAVRRPAAAVGRPFAAGVAEEIVAGLSGDDDGDGPRVAPALLQSVCARLWQAIPGHVGEISELELRRCGGVSELLAQYCDQAVATVASDHGLPAGQLWSWIQEWFITEFGERAFVNEGHGETRGMPNAVVRALRDWHLISAELRAGSRWYALQHDCLIAPVREARERSRGLAATLPGPRSPAEYLSAAEAALAAGEPALARRHAARALRESSGQDLGLSVTAETLLGNAGYRLDDMAAAERHYRAAAALSETLRDTPFVGYLLAAVGRTLCDRGEYRSAVDCLYGAVARLPSDQAVREELGAALQLIELAG